MNSLESVLVNPERGVSEGTPRGRPVPFIVLALVVGLCPLLLGVDALGWGPASPQTNWVYLIHDRVTAHAKRITGPKIIFAGGSNMAFGVNPLSLTQRLGRPVLSYGLHIGVELDAILEGVEPLVGPGDIIVVAPELNHFVDNPGRDRSVRSDWLVLTHSRIKDPVGQFPRRPWMAMRERCRGARVRTEKWWAEGLMAATGHPPPPPPKTAYQPEARDADGNLIYPRPAPLARVNRAGLPVDKSYFRLETGPGMGAIAALAQVCRERGATLAVMPAVRTTLADDKPPVMAKAVEREAEWLKYAQEHYGVLVLLPAGGTVLGPECAFDTTYHLNDKGVAIIEDRLVPVLKSLMDRK